MHSKPTDNIAGVGQPEADEVDRLIETALSTETMRPVPEDLHSRIADRLHVASMLDKERQRFRNAAIMGGVAFVGVVVCLGLFAVLADIPGFLMYGVPGGMGYWDYMTTTLVLTWTQVITSLAMVLAGVAIMALLVALLPVQRLALVRLVQKIQ